MNSELENEKAIIQYLLGELPPEQRTVFEERYLSDPEFLELVLVTEDELINDYVCHRLSPRERELFDRYFLSSSDGRERVNLAEILIKQLNEPHAAAAVAYVPGAQDARLRPGHPLTAAPIFLRLSSTPMRLMFAVLLLIATCGSVWLIIEKRRSRARSDEAGSQPIKAEGLARQSQTPPTEHGTEVVPVENKTQPQPERVVTAKVNPKTVSRSTSAKADEKPYIASFVLTPGLSRSEGETKTIAIPPAAQLVELQLSVDSNNDYKSYRASLQRIGDGEIWTGKVFPTQSQIRSSRSKFGRFTLKLPVGLLTKGDYLLTLTGVTATGEFEVAGDYPFTCPGGKMQ